MCKWNVLAALTLAMGCITVTEQPMSKEEARALQKADGTDFCQAWGWYGDGICDDFCLKPDPDCAAHCKPLEPGCGDNPLPAAGCYEECTDDSDCGSGTVCLLRSYNPCSGNAICEACGAEVRVCVPPPAATCCDPAKYPTGAREGAHCCADGSWALDIGNGSDAVCDTNGGVGKICGTPTPPPCVVGGCSGEICSDQALASPCIWLPEFACYDNATCERQSDGKCGWTMTDSLKMCLANN